MFARRWPPAVGQCWSRRGSTWRYKSETFTMEGDADDLTSSSQVPQSGPVFLMFSSVSSVSGARRVHRSFLRSVWTDQPRPGLGLPGTQEPPARLLLLLQGQCVFHIYSVRVSVGTRISIGTHKNFQIHILYIYMEFPCWQLCFTAARSCAKSKNIYYIYMRSSWNKKSIIDRQRNHFSS